MGILQLNSPCLSSLSLPSNIYNKTQKPLKFPNHLNYSRGRIKAIDTTISGTESEATPQEEPPSIDFAFVHSVLLPDGSPDIHTRSACGGQKLRDIMLDGDIDLYGPYARALLNCGGGGTCGTCLVEVVAGKELLNPRTDKEKEILKKKPKTWRLACQTMVGKEDSRGQVVIQTLPEWKAHEWD
ncbi:photosynthetic NDH subunit of subcomplex B 3, chloroplastic isoform X2 [Magnolia sinica]|uniref:photosynthetic NDH subunit of subcomplex B 3, chloroplastic isoform X2 n=1 Tax=Magnolia sinica TaxID=86752 RepID=UPI00265A5A37|nr:photosynthetic NDH subunit of subcomplex B 3, chloroplastic isoform X2 [Magnolia sinica]